MHIAEIYKKVRPSIVSLTTIEKINKNESRFHVYGSGVCIDKRGLFITAKHCVIDADTGKTIMDDPDFKIVTSTFITNNKLSALSFRPTKIGILPEYDLAFLSYDGKDVDIANFTPIRIPEGDQFEYSEGEQVWCSGYPVTSFRTNLSPNVFSGIISRIDIEKVIGQNDKFTTQNIVLDMSLHEGCSGGAIFDQNGFLIAIVSGQELRKAEFDELSGMNDIPEIEKALVWTNLIHCIPNTVFKAQIEKIKKKLYG